MIVFMNKYLKKTFLNLGLYSIMKKFFHLLEAIILTVKYKFSFCYLKLEIIEVAKSILCKYKELFRGNVTYSKKIKFIFKTIHLKRVYL